MDCAVHGLLRARILEWVAFPFSRGSSQPRDQTQVSRIAGRFLAEPQGKARGQAGSYQKQDVLFQASPEGGSVGTDQCQ